MHALAVGGDGAVFKWNISAFLLRSTCAEIFTDLYNFPESTQSSWSHLSLSRCTWTRLLFSMLPTQLLATFPLRKYKHSVYFRKHAYPVCHPRKFRGGNTCIVFTLGYTCISCYATHTFYVACQRNLLPDIQHGFLFFWKEHCQLFLNRTNSII